MIRTIEKYVVICGHMIMLLFSHQNVQKLTGLLTDGQKA